MKQLSLVSLSREVSWWRWLQWDVVAMELRQISDHCIMPCCSVKCLGSSGCSVTSYLTKWQKILRSLIRIIKRFLIWANICKRFNFWICLKEKSIIFGENSKSRQNMKRNHDKVNHVKQNSNRLTSSTIVIGQSFIRTLFASWTPDCLTVKNDLITGRGYIDNENRCFRENMLVTTIGCWWRYFPFCSPTFTIF